VSNQSEWKEVILRDLCESVRYGYTAKAQDEQIGPKFLRITDIVPDLVDWASVPYCEINPENIEKYKLQEGDIVIARTGATTGYAKWVKDPPEAVFASYLVRLRIAGEHDSRFVGFVVESDTYKQFIMTNIGGAAQPNANAQILTSFPMLLPPLPIQRKIAAILSAYDDLIENNTRRIAVLEEMARLLYREWFVHFRFPGHEQVTMVDSELGPVPEGWEMVTVGDLYRTSSGGTPSRKVNEYFGGSIDWVKTRELRDSFTFETEEKITELGLQKSSAKLFPANTVIMAMYGATIGMLGILASPAATNQACCAILEDTPSFGHSYAFLYLLENRNELINLGMGAAQQNISQRVIKNFKMLKPTTPILRRFNDSVDPIFDYIKVLQSQVANLRRTRDLLLPRLISGEVDVSDLSL
jgi:type I restriction enzyme S subunit